MSLTRQEVEKLSLLARLELTPEELDRLTGELGQIVGYFELFSELNLADVQPMVHAVELTNVLVEDEVASSLDRKQALANAPRQDGEFYLVPAVLGE